MQINSNFFGYVGFGSYAKDSMQEYKKISYEIESEDSKDSREESYELDKQDKEKENTEMVNGKELEPDEADYVRELERIDRNVKAHESAHIAAGAGVVTGGASYSYTRGPDGRMYATAGEVPISMQKGDTPQETIQNARKIVAAAMAPADPSPQDYKVAASAMQMESQARVEMAQESQEKLKEDIQKREEDRIKSEDEFLDKKQNKKNSYEISSYIQNQSNNIDTPKLEIAG